jgi:DNA polymerase eta
MNAGKFILHPEKLKNTNAYSYGNIGDFITSLGVSYDPYSEGMELSESEKRSILRSKKSLLVAASITNEICDAVKSITGFECSVGIAHNKILAKLACGLNKVIQQTILPLDTVPKLFETLHIHKIVGVNSGRKIF